MIPKYGRNHAGRFIAIPLVGVALIFLVAILFPGRKTERENPVIVEVWTRDGTRHVLDSQNALWSGVFRSLAFSSEDQKFLGGGVIAVLFSDHIGMVVRRWERPDGTGADSFLIDYGTIDQVFFGGSNMLTEVESIGPDRWLADGREYSTHQLVAMIVSELRTAAIRSAKSGIPDQKETRWTSIEMLNMEWIPSKDGSVLLLREGLPST